MDELVEIVSQRNAMVCSPPDTKEGLSRTELVLASFFISVKKIMNGQS